MMNMEYYQFIHVIAQLFTTQVKWDISSGLSVEAVRVG